MAPSVSSITTSHSHSVHASHAKSIAKPKRQVDRAKCMLIAELAAEAERYQGKQPPLTLSSEKSTERVIMTDVVAEIKKIIVGHNAQLTLEERSLLSIAYKNLTNNLRNSWRTVESHEGHTAAQAERSPKRQRDLVLIRQQRHRIESDLLNSCNEIIELLDRYLLLAAKPGEEAVFYSKMKGDYYRYLAEFGPEKERPKHGDLSLQAYKIAYKRALSTLDPLDPTRLGLALNFSVFYHDVYKSPARACHLAKSAFDDAVQSLNPAYDTVDQTLRDSLSILQLLRDDLLLWVEEM